MLCQACHRFTSGYQLCVSCRRRMRPAPERILPGGVRLVAAFQHTGPARTLVHHLKYRGLTVFADLVASVVAPRLPRLPIVPVPRAFSRRLRYGVDPSRLIAAQLALRLGTPVLPALAPPLHTPRRAGGDHASRAHVFGLRVKPSHPVLVVDDVVTTGATLISAMTTIGPKNVGGAVSANVVPQVSSLSPP